MTSYIAEFMNTLTNLIYGMVESLGRNSFSSLTLISPVYLGYRGLMNNWSREDRSFLAALPYFGIIGVGVGSALFHASLKYYMQLSENASQ